MKNQSEWMDEMPRAAAALQEMKRLAEKSSAWGLCSADDL
jgi:hypothetical protein